MILITCKYIRIISITTNMFAFYFFFNNLVSSCRYPRIFRFILNFGPSEWCNDLACRLTRVVKARLSACKRSPTKKISVVVKVANKIEIDRILRELIHIGAESM